MYDQSIALERRYQEFSSIPSTSLECMKCCPDWDVALQSWEDEDVAAALEWLKEKLAEDIKLLSSWDKYKKEVLSGSLEWSPMHTSDQFWLENSPKFEERDCQVRHFHTLKVSSEE